MEEKLSLKQALIMTRESLAEINVPIALVGQIGMPVSRAIANLDACIDAIGRQEAEGPKAEEPAEEEEDGAEDA